MSFGERAALEGILAQVKPRLAVEIGTAEGGSLSRIAAHSEEVHSIDLVRCPAPQPEHVELHVGDSRRLLPELLERFASEGRVVDFVLVDGDHAREGVRQDLIDLLASPAISATVIVMHDTLNGLVRAGITDVDFASNPAVAFVELDFVGGYMARTGPFAGQLWGGLGVAVVDADTERRPGIYNDYLHDAYGMIRELGGSPTGAADGGRSPALLGRVLDRWRH
ncbi:MAG: class I SAM-dependent methyltransferase [Solirubrobacterales bacterium]|nr:class I SAM-dependent methyltransferase [Solirubrobacterales bacterium]